MSVEKLDVHEFCGLCFESLITARGVTVSVLFLASCFESLIITVSALLTTLGAVKSDDVVPRVLCTFEETSGELAGNALKMRISLSFICSFEDTTESESKCQLKSRVLIVCTLSGSLALGGGLYIRELWRVGAVGVTKILRSVSAWDIQRLVREDGKVKRFKESCPFELPLTFLTKSARDVT